MPEQAKVAVIVVNYETSQMVRRLLASLSSQRIAHETVVVDNPSPARDADNLEGCSARLLRLEENLGYGQANNAGAALTSAPYVCVLNPDTVVPDQALEHWVEVFEREQARGRHIGLLAPRLLNDNGTPQRSIYQFVNPINYWLYHSILAGAIKQARKRLRLGSQEAGASPQVKKVDWVMGAAMLIPRSVWQEISGFGENYFLYAEDTDLCWRLHKAGYEVCFTAEVSIIHTQGEPSPERRGAGAKRLFAGILTFLEQHYRAPRRLGVKLAVMADMALRLAIFTPLAILRPKSVLTKNRLKAAWEILGMYAK